jgi:hypothetical protein
VAYLVTFVTIGILWIEHHGMMSAVRGINRRFLERTLAVLLFISIISWPTAIAANYADHSVPQARAAAVLYAATMLKMGLSFAWGWRYLYLSAHRELVAEPDRAAFPAGARRALLGGLVYLLTSWPSPWPSSAPAPPSPLTPSWLSTSQPPRARSQDRSSDRRIQMIPARPALRDTRSRAAARPVLPSERDAGSRDTTEMATRRSSYDHGEWLMNDACPRAYPPIGAAIAILTYRYTRAPIWLICAPSDRLSASWTRSRSAGRTVGSRPGGC